MKNCDPDTVEADALHHAAQLYPVVASRARLCLHLAAAAGRCVRGGDTHTHAHTRLLAKEKAAVLEAYQTMTCKFLSIKCQEQHLMNGAGESTSHCLRMERLAGLGLSINTEGWQIERRDGPSPIRRIWFLIAARSNPLPVHRLQKPLLGEARQSTDGLWLRYNQEQLAKFTQNK